MVDDLLTAKEAAAYLRVPISWIYERSRTGAIPVRKIGHHIRIPRTEFLVWIDKQSVSK
jgi:excisionase family DNA binding protein